MTSATTKPILCATIECGKPAAILVGGVALCGTHALRRWMAKR